MLKFFKRSDPPVEVPPAKPAPTAKAAALTTDERRRLQRPLPLPEVLEGNTDKDWAMWEESISQQKNQK